MSAGTSAVAGRGLIAATDLAAGDTALEIPFELLISEDLVSQSDLVREYLSCSCRRSQISLNRRVRPAGSGPHISSGC